MVKADVRRDYYAELGLGSHAEPEEIRKQYRKLAFKFHPDRNPGKENEFNSKFQALQTAYEILNDPQLRLKYDTDRLRAGYGRHYSSSRNASVPKPQRAASQYTPTPPRRTAPAPTSKPSHSPKPSYPAPPPPTTSGIPKRSSYAKPGTQPWDQMYENPRVRAEAYKAFQSMKRDPQGAGGWTNFDPRTGRSSHDPGRTERPPQPKTQPSQRPYSAYEAYFATPKQTGTGPQRSQSTKKKNGFAPGTPGGDEPMAKNTSAYASIRSDKAHAPNSYFEPAPPPTARKKAMDDTPFIPNLERTSSRYATAGGEKTYLSGTGFGATANSRSSAFDSPSSRPRTNPPSPTASPARGRPHSESPKLRSSRNRAFSSSTSSSDSDEIVFRKKAQPRSRLPNKSRYNMGNISADTSAWAMNESSWLFNESNGARHTEANRTPTDGWETNTHSSERDSDYRKKPTDRAAGSSKSPNLQFSNPAYASLNGNTRNEKGTHTDGEAHASSKVYNAASQKANETHKTPPKSKSHDQINSTFAAKEWADSFGNGPDFFAPASSSNPNAAKAARGRILNNDKSSHSPPSNFTHKRANSTSDRTSSQPPPPFGEAKFSADHWTENFKDTAWTIPSTDAFQKRSVDSRQRSPRKQSKSAPKRHNVPRPAEVTTENGETEATVPPTAQDTPEAAAAAPADVEAMDIDEIAPSGDSQEQRSAKAKAPAAEPTTSNDTPDLLDLRDLGSVNPFTATNSGGLDDMKDLDSMLPFDSQPELNRTRIKPKDLALPKPPKPPTLPKFTANPGTPGMRPEQVFARATWDRYMMDMAAYMNEWNKFNRLMLSHFNARQNFVDTRLSPNWMSARGDGSQLNNNGNQAPGIGEDEDDESDELVGMSNPGTFGFSAYVRGMEEDFVVRQHWDVAWERHRQCILDLGRARAWIREGRKSQRLPNTESLI